jgi:hypothetical protein
MDVVLETGKSRTFASALDWPGYSRSGKTEDTALAALVAYGPRYRAALGPDLGFRPPSGVEDLRVVERLAGGSGTDFGVPSAEAAADTRPVDEDELARLTGILRAAWAAFDQAATTAVGRELRTGPRGGGRDLQKMIDHVLGGEEAYLTRIGGSGRDVPPRNADIPARMAAVRDLAVESLADRARGVPLRENPRRTGKTWSVRYFVRRSAWHALDHAWEIEDRVL